jgi:hypothetical protein
MIATRPGAAGCDAFVRARNLDLDLKAGSRSRVLGMTMRILSVGTLFIGTVFAGTLFAGTTGLLPGAGASPAYAQAIRATEPLVLAPYESALVQDGSCSTGKVLKVTGAIRGLRRKKACISLGETQASLGSVLQ